MIKIRDLSYSYEPGKTIRFPNLSLEKAGQCLLLGESGSGKTTLLHLMGGLLRTKVGSIQINGTEINDLSESALDRFRGQHVGFVFQKNHLIPALTVRKNLLMAPFLAGMRDHENRVEEILVHLGLVEKQNAKISELSQGQAQRVAIARAVMNRPGIIFADEPTSALDDKNCDRVIDVLMNMARQHQSTLVVATHDYRLKSKIGQQIHLHHD
ncbi:MAG: ABC transporter ATP-binding protein [Bacteroidota bacterium]